MIPVGATRAPVHPPGVKPTSRGPKPLGPPGDILKWSSPARPPGGSVARIFIGVAWPYANGPFHIGHLAGAYLPGDTFARYHRLRGHEVLMVSGSDMHGTPIALRADQEHTTPQ